MAYAVARPDRVGSLVLVGGAPPTSDGLNAGLARFAERLAELQKLGKIPESLPPPDLENDNMDAVMAATFPAYSRTPTRAASRARGPDDVAIQLSSRRGGSNTL